MFAVPTERVARIHASSGTTGQATVVGYTSRDIDTWAEVVARLIRASGGRAGDKVHVAYGYGLFTGGLGAHYGAETWTDVMRHEIEARLDMHAVDIYGLSEVMGPGIANECVETKDGLHIWEDHFYPEIVDPLGDAVQSGGQAGELVFTTLTKEAMPVIRYRTRDLTRLLPGTARTMRRMEKITGRSDDMIILRGVNLFPTQVEELILRTPGLAPHFQLVLSRPARLDEMTVRVEARPEDFTAQRREELSAQLTRTIKQNIGVSSTVDVVEPGTLERSLGKAQRIRDLRPKD